MRRPIALLAALAVCVPLAALAYAKPHLLIEAAADVSCIQGVVCVDDERRTEEATRLYDEALSFVATSIAPLDKKPLIVFCSTELCYQSFGQTKATARSVGGFCIVIGPRGWKPYYVRHEMIHRLQWQHLGVVRMFMEPEWFVEGMAYALSEDPRSQLAEPFQSFRSNFLSWYSRVGKQRLWAEAERL